MTAREHIPILLNEHDDRDSLFWSIIRYARPFRAGQCGQRDCTCRSDSIYSTLSILPTIEEQRESIASSVHDATGKVPIAEQRPQLSGLKGFLHLFCCFPLTERNNETTFELRRPELANGPIVNEAQFITQRQFY